MKKVEVKVGAMATPKRQALKISWESYELLKELTAHAAKYGWTAFGIDREDTPTQTALMDEAIKLLAMKRGKKRRTKR